MTAARKGGPSAASWDERRGRVLLSIVSDAVDPDVHGHLTTVGAARICAELLAGTSRLKRAAAYSARLDTLVGHGVGAVDAASGTVDQAVDALSAMGGRLLIPGDDEWPTGLDDLEQRRPYALWVRGPLALSSLNPSASLAIVGARAATQYGVHVATDLAADLAMRGWSIVSGGAYGIDAAAHRGAVLCGGATVAVLANGVDEVYPKGNSQLLARIVEQGAVVSELPPGRHPTRQGFLARNRIIAALAGGTLVVEAALRSGSASTVARAVELGREVMAVPGPITSAMSTGSNALLRDGATLVTCGDDVVEALAGIGEGLRPLPESSASDRDRLTPDQRALLDAFPARGARDEVSLAATAGLTLSAAMTSLGYLNVDGWVQRTDQGWRLSDKARTG